MMTGTRIRTLGAAAVLATALAAMPAAAAQKLVQHQGASTGEVLIDAVFTEVERRIIHDYFGVPEHDRDRHHDRDSGGGDGGKSKKMPPGLAKRDSLPPGLAKRDVLPPGLAKRDLPDDLLSRLDRPRKGTERIIVDTDVLLVEAATGVVLDIIYDVVTGRK